MTFNEFSELIDQTQKELFDPILNADGIKNQEEMSRLVQTLYKVIKKEGDDLTAQKLANYIVSLLSTWEVRHKIWEDRE